MKYLSGGSENVAHLRPNPIPAHANGRAALNTNRLFVIGRVNSGILFVRRWMDRSFFHLLQPFRPQGGEFQLTVIRLRTTRWGGKKKRR